MTEPVLSEAVGAPNWRLPPSGTRAAGRQWVLGHLRDPPRRERADDAP